MAHNRDDDWQPVDLVELVAARSGGGGGRPEKITDDGEADHGDDSMIRSMRL